ncbi:MAG: UbiA family prenyltransferase [Chloroflexota bacterium]
MVKTSAVQEEKRKRPFKQWFKHLLQTYPFLKLLLNHMDAWGTAFIISMVVLLVHDAATPRTALLLVAYSAGYWLAFTLNDYYDVSVDALDPRKRERNYFVQHPKRNKLAWGIIGLLLLGGFVYIFGQFGFVGLGLLAVCLFVMWAYSAPPLRLKNRPIIDVLTHALFVQTFPYVMGLLLIRAEWTLLDGFIIAVLFFASLTAQIEQQVRDFEADSQLERTFATMLGRDRTNILLKVTTAVMMLIAIIGLIIRIFPPFIITFGALGLPAFLHRFLRQQQVPRSEWLVLGSISLAVVYTTAVFIYSLL